MDHGDVMEPHPVMSVTRLDSTPWLDLMVEWSAHLSPCVTEIIKIVLRNMLQGNKEREFTTVVHGKESYLII